MASAQPNTVDDVKFGEAKGFRLDKAWGKPARFLMHVGLVGMQQLLLPFKNEASWGCGTALTLIIFRFC